MIRSGPEADHATPEPHVTPFAPWLKLILLIGALVLGWLLVAAIWRAV